VAAVRAKIPCTVDDILVGAVPRALEVSKLAILIVS
jgi:hypothetical protein